MAERFAFTVHYDAAVMNSVAGVFLWYSLFRHRGWLTWAAIAVLVAIVAYSAASGDRSWAAGLMAGFALALGFLMALVWWLHHSGIKRKLRAMARPHATIRLADEGLTFEADTGAATVPWRQFKDIWPGKGAWLLVLASNQFVTLPLHGVPEAALAFVKSKVHVTPV